MGTCLSLRLLALLSSVLTSVSHSPLYMVTVWPLDAPSFHGLLVSRSQRKRVSLSPQLDRGPCESWGFARPAYVSFSGPGAGAEWDGCGLGKKWVPEEREGWGRSREGKWDTAFVSTI